MAHHSLKILPCFFEAVLSGQKTFEIRLNDRDYRAFDTVTLLEYSATLGPGEQGYTGRACDRRVGFVTDFAQQPGYVVFSLLPLFPA